MASVRDYLPSREAQLVTFTGEFSTNISKNSKGYGLTVDQATEYATTRERFVTAFNVAQNPLTRTPPNIQAKDAAKTSLINATRMLVDVVQAWPEMTNEKRADLKITLRDRKPTPSPVPSTSPFIKVKSIDGRIVTFECQSTKTSRGKPKDVSGVTLFSHYGPTPPQTAEGWKLIGMSGRTTVTTTFDDMDAGGTVYVTGFWFNGRKQSGPSGKPISISLAATTPLPTLSISTARKAA